MATDGRPITARTGIVIIHPLDPRGGKVGGIETHVHLILAHHPADTDVLLVGIDEIGDARIGVPQPLRHAGRDITFVPVLRVDPATVNRPARRIGQSLTLRFVLAALRRLPAIRRAVGARPAFCEIGRFEFALLPVLLRRSLLLVVHNEGRREDAMDSLLQRHWWLHRLNERIALLLAARVFAVNEAIARRIAGLSPRFAAKTEVLSVSVDTALFRPSPFPREDDALRICYAGRLDAFKDPALMFGSLARVAERLRAAPVGRFRRLAFRYAGPSDPSEIAGHQEIASVTTSMGVLAAPEVAALMRESHLGLVTSVFEGLPCYLLEMLASGRPVAAVDLPQFAGLVVAGISGRLVVRRPSGMAEAMAEAMLDLAAGIADATLDPSVIAERVAPFSVARQMGRLFDAHRDLARAPAATRSASAA